MTGAAASLIFGIAAYKFFPFFPVSISALFILSTSFLLFRKNESRPKVFLLIFIAALGFSYASLRYEPLYDVKLPDTEVNLAGTVIDVPETYKKKMRFTLGNVYLNGKLIEGKVRLFSPDEFYKSKDVNYLLPAYGDRVSAVTVLKEPSLLHNPGLYSYDLRKDGIVAIGYLSGLRVTERGRGPLVWIYKKRQQLGSLIDSSLSKENASLHRAIIPGFKRGIAQDMRDAFSATGLAHLLSISGTHFGLLAFIIFKLIKNFIKALPAKVLSGISLKITPTQIAVLLTLPVLAMYAVISGASTPTVRSFIMIFIYMLALFIGRRGQWLNSLSIAAVIILLWNPGTLFELSFQLSFMAVLSIGYVLEKRSELRDRISETGLQNYSAPGIRNSPAERQSTDYSQLIIKAFNKIKTGLLITVSAVLGTAPLVALVFKQFPLISPLTNLIVTPLICFIILPLGFFTGFTALLFNLSSMPLSWLTDMVTNFALHLVKIFSNIPYSNLHIPNPSFSLVALYFISLLFLVKSRKRWRFLPLIFLLFFYIIRPLMSDDDFKVTFLDVGQGDAALLELPDDKVMLVDGGSEKSDSGRRVIAPYLWSKGVKDIDYLVLSHPHYDHYGGLTYIMDNFNVQEVWTNGRIVPDSEEFFRKMREDGITHRILKRGDYLKGEGYKISVLHPYKEFYADSVRGEFSDENSDSLVIKVEAGGSSVLLTGDIELEAELDLMHLGNRLNSNIIKVPHHGGRTSSSEGFIKAVSPQTAVASAARHNSFRHPHTETLRRYADAGVKFYRTDMDGAVSISINNKEYEVRTYQDFVFKEVRGWRDEMRNLRLLL